MNVNKNYISILCLLVLSLAPWACKPYPILPIGPFPVPTFPSTPTPTATPIVLTPTPTPNLTPVCGYSVVPLGPVFGGANPLVIRNLTDWQNFKGYTTSSSFTPVPTPAGVPTPPVDFSKQMMIVTLQTTCPTYYQFITSICEGPTQITVSANNDQLCAICNVASYYSLATGYVIPQSSLPVTWAITNYPCTMMYPPTPMATP